MVIGGAVLKHSQDFNLMRECAGELAVAITPRRSTCSRHAEPVCRQPSPPPTGSPGAYEVAAAGGVDTHVRRADRVR